MQSLTNQQNNNGEIKPEPDMEKYKDYKAYMDRKFEESKASDKYRAEYQARKDAKLAREKAQREEEKPLKAEPETAEKTLASVPPIQDIQSDNEDPIRDWNTRQHRREQSGGEIQNKDASAIPSRNPSLPATTDMPADNAASSGSSSRRVTLGEIPKTNGGFSRAIEPQPKSRRSSTSSTSSLTDRRKPLLSLRYKMIEEPAGRSMPENYHLQHPRNRRQPDLRAPADNLQTGTRLFQNRMVRAAVTRMLARPRSSA